VLLNINANPGDIVKTHPLPNEKSFLKKIKGKSLETIANPLGAEYKYALQPLSSAIDEKGKARNLCIFLSILNISLRRPPSALTRLPPPSFNIDNKDFHSERGIILAP